MTTENLVNPTLTPAELVETSQLKTEFLLQGARARYEGTYGHAQSAFRSLFLAHGAAIISLLTVLGNTGAAFGPNGMRWAFVWFVVGLSLAMLANLAAYRAQSLFAKLAFFDVLEEIGQLSSDLENRGIRIRRQGEVLAATSFVSIAISLVLFAVGSFVALNALV